MHAIKFTILSIFVFTLSLNVNAKDDFDKPKVRLKAPDFSIQNSEGKISLKQHLGKLVILNFWSLECRPCVEEMKSLDYLSRRFNKNELKIIAISSDSNDQLKQYIKKHQYHFRILHDKDAVIRNMYEVKVLPTTYIIGRDGKFLARIIGARNWINQSIFKILALEH